MFGRIGAGSWQTVTRAGLAVLTGLYLLGLVTYREAVASSQPASSMPSGVVAESNAGARAHLSETYGKLPLSFVANHGQTDPGVDFLARGPGYSLFLTASEAVLGLHRPTTSAAEAEGAATGAVLRMQLVEGADRPEVAGLDELPGRVNSFRGSDPTRWQTDVPTYGKVRYAGVYPGIDLVYYGKQRQLEYDFVVAPGADPSTIGLRFIGAERLEIDEQGDLLLHLDSGLVRQPKPFIYQEVDGARREVGGGFTLLPPSHEGLGDASLPLVTFQLGPYDTDRPLVIDPELAYSTYLGSAAFDEARAIAVDAAGNAYVTGRAGDPSFPTTPGAYDRTCGVTTGCSGSQSTDVFVTKLGPSGSLVYSTFLGGDNSDYAFGIAVDAAGNAYVTGLSFSGNFSTTPGAFDEAMSNSGDAFVTKLNPSGSGLVYSTFLGGGLRDFGRDIAVDSAGTAYVTGRTDSPDFPTTPNAFDQVCGSDGACDGSGTDRNGDVFFAKLDAAGASLLYSTFLGGPGTENTGDQIGGVAIDGAGRAYVTGETWGGFPVTAGALTTPDGRGAFVAKIDPTQSGAASLVYAAVLGSGWGTDVAVDGAGNAWVTGAALSSGFPTTPGAVQPTFGGGFDDAFVARLNPSGSGLVYSTFLGGDGNDEGMGIALDAGGNTHVVGYTRSATFPTASALRTTLAGDEDAFVTKLKADGSALVYSTYFGGNGGEVGYGIAVAGDSAYIVGQTSSSDLPTTSGVAQPNSRGGADAFVAKITDTPTTVDLRINVSESADPASTAADLTYTAVVTNDGPAPATGVSLAATFSGSASNGFLSIAPTAAQGSCAVQTSQTGSGDQIRSVSCELGTLASGASTTVTVVVEPNAQGALTLTADVASDLADSNTANNRATAETTIDAPDLALTKTHVGDFTEGEQGAYTLTVRNVGTAPTGEPIRIIDSLPPGLTYVSGGGGASGWTCSATPRGTGQSVDCTNPGPIPVGGMSSLVLTVNVGTEALPSVTNTAQVQTRGDINANGGANEASDATTVIPTTSKPRLTLTINDGDACSISSTVRMVLVVLNPETQPTQMRFSQDGVTFLAFGPLLNGASFELAGGDGVRLAYAQLRTDQGVLSDVVSDDIRVDATQPLADFVSPGEGLTNQARPLIKIVLTDDGSGIDSASIALKIDGVTVQHVFTPVETAPDGRVTRAEVTFQPEQDLANAEHTIDLTALDKCGNPARVVPRQVLVDTVPPQINEPAPSGSGLLSFTLPGGDGGKIVFDGEEKDLEVTFEEDEAQVDTSQLPDGTYTIFVEVKDQAGNIARQTFTFVVDANPPVVTFGPPTPAPNAAGWHNTDVSIPFTATDKGSGVQSTTPAASPLVLTTEGTAITGTVTAIDNSGKTSTATSPAVKIDKTKPTCVVTRGGANPELTVQDALSGLKAVTATTATNVTLNPPAFTAGTTTPVVVTATKQDQSLDSRLVVRVTDVAENTFDCEPIVTTGTPTTASLTVTKAGTGGGTVTSQPAGINCGTDCTEAYAIGATVTLTAAPATGSAFAGWSGACTNATGTCTVTIDAAKTVTATFNTAPLTADAGGPYTGQEGSSVQLTGKTSDPGTGGTLTYAWTSTAGADVDPGATCTFSDPGKLSTSFTCTDDGTFEVKLTVSAGAASPVSDTASVKLTNVKPSVTITAPPSGSVHAVGTAVNFSGTFADPGKTDTHTAKWSFDGTTINGAIASNGAVSGSHTFTTAGVYRVKLAVTDDDGDVGEATTVGDVDALVVVYDPNGGFVTGGGWFDSPSGACRLSDACRGAVGKANFGFVSKYQRGATTPSGQTEFRFKAGGLDFHSPSYEWLVVSGARAQYKGTGTINGSGNYGFLLTATDGQVSGGGGTDKFRIKITDKNNGDAVVYDNQMGAADDAAPATALGGGSIVINAK